MTFSSKNGDSKDEDVLQIAKTALESYTTNSTPHLYRKQIAIYQDWVAILELENRPFGAETTFKDFHNLREFLDGQYVEKNQDKKKDKPSSTSTMKVGLETDKREHVIDAIYFRIKNDMARLQSAMKRKKSDTLAEAQVFYHQAKESFSDKKTDSVNAYSQWLEEPAASSESEQTIKKLMFQQFNRDPNLRNFIVSHIDVNKRFLNFEKDAIYKQFVEFLNGLKDHFLNNPPEKGKLIDRDGKSGGHPMHHRIKELSTGYDYYDSFITAAVTAYGKMLDERYKKKLEDASLLPVPIITGNDIRNILDETTNKLKISEAEKKLAEQHMSDVKLLYKEITKQEIPDRKKVTDVDIATLHFCHALAETKDEGPRRSLTHDFNKILWLAGQCKNAQTLYNELKGGGNKFDDSDNRMYHVMALGDKILAEYPQNLDDIDSFLKKIDKELNDLTKGKGFGGGDSVNIIAALRSATQGLKADSPAITIKGKNKTIVLKQEGLNDPKTVAINLQQVLAAPDFRASGKEMKKK